MSEGLDVQQLPSAPSVGSPREGSPISLLVLHSDPRPARHALAAFTAPDAHVAPHYYIDAGGAVTPLVPEQRAAHHSGLATWAKRRRNIDRISIGITLEHTPGTAHTPAALAALHTLVAQLRTRHALNDRSLVRWESKHQGGATKEGLLIPVLLPPVQPTSTDGAVLGAAESEPAAPGDDFACVPPEAPPPTQLPSGELGSGLLGSAEDQQLLLRIWTFLSNETYRQRGEGLQSNWAFHRYAPKNDLGAPLSHSSNATNQISIGGTTYGFQVFARDTVFNAIPQWTEVQSLNSQINGVIPGGGLSRALLEATFAATGNTLNPGWAFHQRAIAERLGPPLSGSYTIPVEGRDVNLQVFAGDTLYCFPPAWGDVKRLSQTEAGPLREALWAEAYKPSGVAYDPGSAFHQQAVAMNIGMPLTGVYQADFEGNTFTLQVFTHDTLYTEPNGSISRLSGLPGPDIVNNFQAAQPPPADTSGQPGSGGPDDALSNRRPTFALLPLAGQPRISQFFGYTRWSAGNGRQFYQQTQGRHSGIDFGVPVGTQLLSVGYGVVLCAALNSGCPFGASKPGSIVVRYGSMYALYGHASAVFVSKGQLVKPGDVLGLSGDFGGPHLHFEMRPVPDSMLGNTDPNQNPVNPTIAFNPVPYFSTDLQPYFSQKLTALGGLTHFCRDSFADQPDVKMGAPPDTRPCTN